MNFKFVLERDVRQIINVGDLNTFDRFLRVCAARTGQILNLSEISRDVGVSVPTVKKWISILEASYQIYLLPLETKASATLLPGHAKSLIKWRNLAGEETVKGVIVAIIDNQMEVSGCRAISWKFAL